MEIKEKNPNRLIIKAKTPISLYLIIPLLLLLAYVSFKQINSPTPAIAGQPNLDASTSSIWYGIMGIIAIFFATLQLLGVAKSTLIIDKEQGILSIKKWFFCGLVPVSRQVKINDVKHFVVQHKLAGPKGSGARLKFIFKTTNRKLNFLSGRLHYDKGVGLFSSSTATDPHNSHEEQYINLISEYIAVVPSENNRL